MIVKTRPNSNLGSWFAAGALAALLSSAGCASPRAEPVLPMAAPAAAVQEPQASLQATEPAPGSAVVQAGYQPAADAAPRPAPAGGSESQGPRTIQEALQPPPTVLPEPPEAIPVQYHLDMTEALALAAGENPQITFAAARYRKAYAEYDAAKVLWLPSLRAGVSYNHHEGTIQETPGGVPIVSRSALNAGLGTGAIAAGSPGVPGVSMQFHAADAIFQPPAAAHQASAQQAATRTATNDTLLATSLAYLELLRAVQDRAIARDTESNTRQLAELTSSFAKAGQGLQSDADRMQAEYIRRQNNVARADEAVRVASARLAQLLRLDPQIEIQPREPAIVPIDLVSPELPPAELVATGLANRPELSESQHLVCEAVYRYRREKYAPLVPSVLLGISQGGFGGGVGSEIDNFRDRFDFDAAAFWEIRNLGFGEGARRDSTRAQYDQARARQVLVMDQIAREVTEAHTQVDSRTRQMAIAESGIKAAEDSFRRNRERIRAGQGLPIEVLQSLQSLDDARRDYLRALRDYNEAQFRLQRAIGWPIR